MKFKVTLKDPDTLHDAIREAVDRDLANICALSKAERSLLTESRCEEVSSMCAEWFGYGEYLTVEIDTDAKTATVCARAGR